MCGFAGTISKGAEEFSSDVLKRMASMIVHRGPDDEGFFTESDWVKLAFRRLSILDLSEKGHQPMLSSDGRYVIVFNGEIYNYREIREELKALGHVFKSDCDTEVLLNSYIQWGAECLKRFIGMFAFVVSDLREKKVFAARDPLGIKPLFLFEDSKFFIFCSEVKSLLPYTSLEPDTGSFNEYLVFRSLPGRNTMFKNVRNVLPGSYLEYSGGKMTEHKYYDLADSLKFDFSRSFEEVYDETEKIIKDSVSLHLRSDVELGMLLSGGVDSSLITAMAANETHKKFHTFSISFNESEYDESKYQKEVSERYGTEHHNYVMGENIFTSLFEKSIWNYEHPLNDPNTVCTMYLVENAKKYITVMLAGEGADEAYMGYTRFLPDTIKRLKFRNWLYRHPGLRDCLYRMWPVPKGKLLFKVTRYCPPMYTLSYADPNDIDPLLNGSDGEMEFRHEIIGKAGNDIINQAILQDQVCDQAQWFSRSDRMGMAASMELRVPFCTVPVFENANSIPYEQRVYKGERKAVLKKICEKYTDKELIYRKKVGFGTPIPEWLKNEGPFKELFESTLESEKFKKRPFVNHEHFNSLYDGYKNGVYEERNSAFLWTYFNLEKWYRIFFEDGWKNMAGN